MLWLLMYRHKQQPNGSLLVGPLRAEDSGWVLCVATRERERDYRYIYLSVSGKYIKKNITANILSSPKCFCVVTTLHYLLLITCLLDL